MDEIKDKLLKKMNWIISHIYDQVDKFIENSIHTYPLEIDEYIKQQMSDAMDEYVLIYDIRNRITMKDIKKSNELT